MAECGEHSYHSTLSKLFYEKRWQTKGGRFRTLSRRIRDNYRKTPMAERLRLDVQPPAEWVYPLGPRKI